MVGRFYLIIVFIVIIEMYYDVFFWCFWCCVNRGNVEYLCSKLFVLNVNSKDSFVFF